MRPRAAPRAVGLAAAALAALLVGPAEAHHLGAYVPRDDEITASFKRMKVYLEKGRADLLGKEFVEDQGIRRRMLEADRRQRTSLAGDMEKALAARDLPGAERTLVRFFCLLAREKAEEALERLGRGGLSARQKGDQGVKLLAAAWRYYNLVDFRVGSYAPRVPGAAKVVFEDAEYYLGKSSRGQAAFDEPMARGALTRFRDLMTECLGALLPAGAEARRP